MDTLRNTDIDINNHIKNYTFTVRSDHLFLFPHFLEKLRSRAVKVSLTIELFFMCVSEIRIQIFLSPTCYISLQIVYNIGDTIRKN